MRDGMNLVAKEFVACRTKGSLISDFFFTLTAMSKKKVPKSTVIQIENYAMEIIGDLRQVQIMPF